MAFFLESATLLGVPRSVAAIYGICFASPEPLTFSDIQQRLNISAGSISQGLRVLREVGALKVCDGIPVSTMSSQPLTPGSFLRETRKRERYEPDLELRNLFLRFIDKRLDQQLDSGRDALQMLLTQIPTGANGSAKLLKARMKALQTWHDKARAVLPIIKTFLKLT